MDRQLTGYKHSLRYRFAARLGILWRAGRHPFAVPVIALATMMGITGGAYWFAQQHRSEAIQPNIVVISHDHHQQIVSSKEPNVGALLAKLRIIVNPGDVVEPSLDTPIKQDDFRINIYRAVPVEIIDGVHKMYTFSAATTPRSITGQAGLKVYPEDSLVSRPVTNFIRDPAVGERIIIDRATPVIMNLYGSVLTIRTRATTVGQLIQDKNIHTGPHDTITPALSTPIAAGQHIYIDRNGVRIENVPQVIAMPITTIDDPNLAYGTSAVRQLGSPGQQVVTYQIILRNGRAVGRVPIQTVVVQQPVPEIVAQGINLSGIKGDMALAGIASGDYTYVDYIVSHESGWCPTKWQGQWGGCPAYHGTPGYGVGYGLCQATPGYKMSSAGADWATNPVTQLRWCNSYALNRYGSWYEAYRHWLNYSNW